MEPAQAVAKIGFFVRSVISWPIRVMFYFFGIPNFRVVYKSGCVKYFFFMKFEGNRDGGKLVRAEWDASCSLSSPILFNIDDIESIDQLY